MMRVAHTGNYKPDNANGVNKTIAGLVKHLPSEEFEVELWHFTPKVAAVRERRVDGFNIFDLPFPRSRLRNAISLPEKTRRFLKWRSREVDLVHLHSVFVPENIWISRQGVRYVVTPNGGYGTQVIHGRNRLLKKAWTLLWEDSYLKDARAIHAVSSPEVDDLRDLEIEAPITFIPNGVDSALLKRRLPRPGEGSTWVYLGRLAVDHKGLDTLVEGYASLHRRHNGDLPPLVLAGPDFRGGRSQLEDLARGLGISDSVRFEGPVFGESKWALLAQARLFLHTSRWEGMPFAVLEALALGRPVLLTPQTNLAAQVEEYESGWIVERTTEAVAEGLNTVLGISPGELDAVGERARSLVEDHFSWPSLARQMAGVYREAIR